MIDFSTLNMDELRKLPVYSPASVTRNKHHISNQMGSGCAGDPPGYPSYFLRAVYKENGNPPAFGPQYVISLGVTHYVVCDAADYAGAGGDYSSWQQRHAETLHKLWKPLPYHHPRVAAWIYDTYRRHADCYIDDAKILATKDDSRNMVIIPVPSYKLEHFHDDARFSEEWRTKAKDAVETANAEIQRKAAIVGVPENHDAYRIVKSFYPEHQPDLVLIRTDKFKSPTSWWEVEAERPTPEACKPLRGIHGAHPLNGNWCQWCGWAQEEK